MVQFKFKCLVYLPSCNIQFCAHQVSLLIRRELFERAKDFNIILDDVAITELSFSREYTAAVEAKQVGEQKHRRKGDQQLDHI